MTDRKQQFQDLAGTYQKCRPSYPDEIFRTLHRYVSDAKLSTRRIIDVGSGTGISTRLLAQNFGSQYKIIGVEPGKSMLEQANASSAEFPNITFVNGAAENLPIRAASAELVTVAQAAHWFDRPLFYTEAARVLEPGGYLGIMQNNRRWDEDKFQGLFEDFLEKYSPNYTRYYRSFDFLGEMQNHDGFVSAEKIVGRWERTMTADEFVGLCLSTTYIDRIVKKLGRDETVDLIRKLISDHHQPGQPVIVPYRTELYLARRND